MIRKDNFTTCKLWDIHMFASTDSGEGFVNIGEDFYGEPDIWQIDVLNDWMSDLDSYRQMLLDMRSECILVDEEEVYGGAK